MFDEIVHVGARGSTNDRRSGVWATAERVLADLNSAFPGRKTIIGPAVMCEHRREESLEGDQSAYRDLARRHGWTSVPQPYRILANVAVVSAGCAECRYLFKGHPECRWPNNTIYGPTGRTGIVYRTVGQKTAWTMEVGQLAKTSIREEKLAVGIVVQEAALSRPVPLVLPIKRSGHFVFDGVTWGNPQDLRDKFVQPCRKNSEADTA